MAGASQFMFGSGLLYGTRNDTTGNTPRRFGTMQDVSIDFDGEIKELYGQFQYPVDVARGKTKITGKAKFATVSGEIFNDIFFGNTLVTGQEAFAYNEAATIPATVQVAVNASAAAGSTTLTFATVPTGVSVGSLVKDNAGTFIPSGAYVVSKNAGTVVLNTAIVGAGVGATDTIHFSPAYQVAFSTLSPITDLGVYYSSTGANLNELSTLVFGSPAGNYNFIASLGAYQFADADAGAALQFNYKYVSASGEQIQVTNQFMGTTPRFQAVFTAAFEGQQVVFTLLNCVSSKIMFATKIDDYTIPEMDFSAFASANGSVATLSFAN